jgi:SAM-dependent methyltransferase
VDDSEIMNLDALESTHFWYRARKAELKAFFEASHGNGLKVLDLGSASGGNTALIQSLGHQVTSVEFSSIGVEIQKLKGIPVIQADARKLPFASESFDVVICLDVLEHIFEDYLAIAEIERVLKTRGQYLISVPEDMSLWSAHDVAVNHFRRYSGLELKQKIEESGLKLESLRSTLILLRPFILMARRFLAGSSLRRVNPIVNSFLYLICRIESRLNLQDKKGVTLWSSGFKP